MTTAANTTASVESTAPAESAALQAAAWVALASVAASLVLRGLYLAQEWRIDWATFPMFLGDEGVHGLMAMHILEGARPIFYYGAYYHGSFDAYVTALLLRLLGPSLTVVRLTPLLFSLLLIATAYGVGRRLYGRGEALLAAALVALPSKFVFEWGSLSLCGYCGYAAMVVGLLFLTTGLLEKVTPARLVWTGLVSGVSVWSNQLSIAYVAVCLAGLWWWSPLRRKDWLVLALAGLVGLSPLIYGNIQTPFSTFRQLGRKALFAWTLSKQDVSEPEAQGGEAPGEAREYGAHPLLEVLGVQSGRDGTWSPAGSGAAVLLAFGFLSALRRCRHSRRAQPMDFRRHVLLLGLIGAALLMGIGGFSGQPVGRYQLPLYPLLAVATAGWLFGLSPRLASALVALVAAVHAVEISTPAQTDETTPTAAVIEALEAKGLRHGFAANAMYEVVFRSAERILLVPLDHSRYRPYELQVEGAESVFYVYRDYQERKPAHRAMLRHLAAGGVTYERMDVGDFHILYDFRPRAAMSLATVAEVRSRFRKEKFGQ